MRARIKAGRGLDALVAREIMGWTRSAESDVDGVGEKPGGTAESPLPRFSTDIGAAWQLLEELQGMNYIVRLWSPNEDSTTADVPAGGWECSVWKYLDRRTGRDANPRDIPAQFCQEIAADGQAETAALAICLAALKAYGFHPDTGDAPKG